MEIGFGGSIIHNSKIVGVWNLMDGSINQAFVQSNTFPDQAFYGISVHRSFNSPFGNRNEKLMLRTIVGSENNSDILLLFPRTLFEKSGDRNFGTEFLCFRESVLVWFFHINNARCKVLLTSGIIQISMGSLFFLHVVLNSHTHGWEFWHWCLNIQRKSSI
jgi:hypothetical protein